MSAQKSLTSFFKRSSPTVRGMTTSATKRTAAARDENDPSIDNRSPKKQALDNSENAPNKQNVTPDTDDQKQQSADKSTADSTTNAADSTVDPINSTDPPKFHLSNLLQEPGWKSLLSKEMAKPYFNRLSAFVEKEYNSNVPIFPPQQDIFNCLHYCTLDSTKVVIIGQDPYHGPNQAHGLAFSVQQGVTVPPSLRNIYKEAHNDVGITVKKHGELSSWAKQGVLLLNTVLTVRKAQAHSHKKQGWETFTDATIRILSKEKEGLVFLLWGKPAQAKADLIDKSKHHIITSSHPSPLGATKTNKPFIGSKCFSRTNKYLEEHGKDPINWQN